MINVRNAMISTRSGLSKLMLCLLILALLTSTSHAQGFDRYPERVIRLVVPFAAGGATDVLARLIGHKLTALMGQQIVVENRPGANGNLGTDLVAKSAPDGYTLVLVADGTVAINPSLYAKLSYDPEKDLVPVSRVALLSLILVAHPSVKANTLQELIALGQDPNSNLHFSSAGPGSTGHLAGELLKSRTGIRMNHVPYKGGGQAVNDVVAGEVQLLVTGLLDRGPIHRSEATQADRYNLRQAGFRRSHRADGDGKRRKGFRRRVLVRNHGAGPYAARDRREAQSRNHQGAARSRTEGQVGGDGCRTHR